MIEWALAGDLKVLSSPSWPWYPVAVNLNALSLISQRGGAGHRLGKGLSLASCSAFGRSLQGTDCAGCARVCSEANARDDCCRRLRGSGGGAIGSMGLRPRLSAAAAFAAYWNPRADARGIVIYLKILSVRRCCGLGESGEAAVGLAHPRKRPLQVFLIKRRSRAST